MRKTVDKIKQWVGHHPRIFAGDEAYQLASLKYAPEMADVIWEVKKAFEKGIPPEKSQHGSSSTFFLKDCDGAPIAVFKMDNFLQEVIAYRLDRRGFAGVPPTVLTVLDHPLFGGPSWGSCQYFVKEALTAVEAPSSLFDHLLASSVRRLASLDIRIMNEDRHTSNILILDDKAVVPIDHGFILPKDLSTIHFVWSDWQPSFTSFSHDELAYISLLDPEEDRNMLLKDFFVEEKLANRLFVATIVLKMAAEKGFPAMAIGKLMTRERPKDPFYSRFEYLIEKIKGRNPANWELFSRYVYEEVEQTLNQYTFDYEKAR